VLVALQIALGAVIIWSRRAVTPTTTHVVIGAALLATSLVITLRAFRAIAMPRLVAPRLDVRSMAAGRALP
jgi:heme A synthase